MQHLKKLGVLVLSLTVFSCTKEASIDVSSKDRFKESVEAVIQSNADQLNTYDLRMIFSFALGAADFRDLPFEYIKEFEGMNQEEFRNLMFSRGSEKFKDIRAKFKSKVTELEQQLDESTKRKNLIESNLASSRQLDAKDAQYFQVLANNIEQINGSIQTSCKQNESEANKSLNISNQSNFDIYVGQIYAEYMAKDTSVPKGLLVKNEAAYTKVKSNSSITIPARNLTDESICDLNQSNISEMLVTEIANPNDKRSFLGAKQALWTPREYSEHVRTMLLELDNINSNIAVSRKTLEESNEVINKSVEAIRMISFMQYKLVTTET